MMSPLLWKSCVRVTELTRCISHILPEGITIAATMDLELQPNHSVDHSGQVPEDRFRIRFYPDGSSSGAIITLRRESLAYTLKVGWLLGRVSMAAGISDDAS